MSRRATGGFDFGKLTEADKSIIESKGHKMAAAVNYLEKLCFVFAAVQLCLAPMGREAGSLETSCDNFGEENKIKTGRQQLHSRYP